MSNGIQRTLSASIRRILRPLVRLLLRNGIPFGVFMEDAKKVYVDVASSEFGVAGRKPSISRTSVLTGLTRKDVSRLWKADDADDASEAPPVDKYNRAARVISGWVRDGSFADGRGRPASLAFSEGERSFSNLVLRHGGDVPPRAVLDELLRVGAVEELKNGRLRLVERAYVPTRGESEKLEILGADVAELISTIDHNLTSPKEQARFQRKVAYDNLPLEFLPQLREEAAAFSQALLEKLDASMSAQDRDANPAATGTGRSRASIGIYYFEDTSEDSTQDPLQGPARKAPEKKSPEDI